MLSTLLYFFLALFLLIVVHEYGHFCVARYFSVKILRFSFGLGYVLASWRSKKGTEFAFSALPFGGYIKMLDETEGEVPPSERQYAFNNKSVWVRIAIAMGGPLFNFIFAFIALWLVLVIGMYSLAPIVNDVKPDSIAAQAGIKPHQEIVIFNGKQVSSWRDFQYAILPLIGTNQPVHMTLKSPNNAQLSQVTLPLQHWHVDEKKPDLLGSLGIIPFIPSIPPIVGSILANSPAEQAGIHGGDKITAINGTSIDDWMELVNYVHEHPDQSTTLGIVRQKQRLLIEIHLSHQLQRGREQGYLGLQSQQPKWPAHWLRLQRETPFHAIGTAFKQTVNLTSSTFIFLERLVTGQLSLKNISGPVGIAQGAGNSARGGFTYYLTFLAWVSISLGVLNILPIPILDGGHLLYCFMEIIRRRPVTVATRTIGNFFGLLFLGTLTIIALSNDLFRLS